MVTTAEAKDLLLKSCMAGWNMGSHKLAREGMYMAMEDVRKAPLRQSLEDFLRDVKDRIEARKQRWRDGATSLDGDDDEDGWLLGGASTVLRIVERAEAAVKARGADLTREDFEDACAPR